LSTGIGDDISLAKQTVTTAIEQGADTIMMKLNNAIPGAEQAIEASGKDINVIYTIVSRCDSGPNVIGTATLGATAFMGQILKDFIDGTLPSGEVKAFGLENPDVQSFDLCPEWQTPDLTALVSGLTEKINSGEVEMPEGI
jgi:basic membrane lipoprotein Med (substrate-binding protein (PBP1-ABC) superfamily)